ELSTPLAAQSKLPAPGAPPIAPSSKPSQQMVSGGKRNSGPNELHGQSPIPKNKAQDTETQTHEESSAQVIVPDFGKNPPPHEKMHAEEVYQTDKIHQVRRWHSRDHKAHKIHEHRSRYRLRQDKDAPDGSHIAPSETIDSTIQDTSTKSTLSLSSKPPMVTSSRTASSSNSVPLSPAHQAIQRGFSDGFMTAKLFAQQGPGMSRLGFKWQYVEDSLRAHGSSIIVPGKEGYYREWFDKGLVQGEMMVAQVIERMNAA
ncbi:SubName: Full=Related to Glucan 1,3-beta-glucosidase {ECO:0000313/EMBL:CCA76533.1}, partial [Serendipita indica DSM 11827]